jgi:ATP-binding cassette, subfamily B, bacterial MsbA
MSKKSKDKSKSSTWNLLYRICSEHIYQYRKKFFIAIACMVFTAIATAINAWLMQPVLDSIFSNKELSMLYVIPAIIILNSILRGASSFYESAIMKRLGQQIVSDIQMRLYSHLIYADPKLLGEYPSGNLISRMTNDINAMRKSVSDVLTGVAQEFCTLLGLICLMFYQSKALAVIGVFIIPLAFFPMIKLGQRMRQISKKMQEEVAGFTVRLDETFQHANLIKSYGREEYEIARAQNVIDKFISLYKRAAYIESAPSPIMEILGSISIACIIWYGGYEIIEGRMTPGAFFSFLTALLMSYKPLKTVLRLNTALQEGLSASKRLFNVLDIKPLIFDDCSLPHIKFKKYDIEFHDVHFSYKTGSKILDGLTFKVPQGKTLALVGGSGVGKTTVLQLLQRLYDSDIGYITIGGQNIIKMRLTELRDNIALVSQETALFDETIMDNIKYGKLDATEQEIIEAAVAAAAHDFIINLPQGYNTPIGQRGMKLSGGQRQRLAIARALLKNAPILLLDEATSALDSISERQVQEALDNLKKGRTTIVIAHRLSSIESADIICILSDGRVAEYGTHTELLKPDSEYSKLYNHYKSSTLTNSKF